MQITHANRHEVGRQQKCFKLTFLQNIAATLVKCYIDRYSLCLLLYRGWPLGIVIIFNVLLYSSIIQLGCIVICKLTNIFHGNANMLFVFISSQIQVSWDSSVTNYNFTQLHSMSLCVYMWFLHTGVVVWNTFEPVCGSQAYVRSFSFKGNGSQCKIINLSLHQTLLLFLLSLQRFKNKF